jgi:hypothetical protein
MLFGKKRWRELYKPHVKQLIDLFHRHNLMVIYHGCGNARDIFDDLVEVGLDAYNPLEAKAGLDVVELKRKYAGKLAFVGNVDVRVLEKGDPEAIRQMVRYKLQAARGGGWVFQSDHSVPADVTPITLPLNRVRYSRAASPRARMVSCTRTTGYSVSIPAGASSFTTASTAPERKAFPTYRL